MDDYSISLGNAVKEARTESKLTQEQIADMLDIDSRTISQIERGLGNPKLETLYPLIRILNVDANTVFYSAPRTETPKLDRLMRLVSTCTEYEAHELIRIVNDILNIMQTKKKKMQSDSLDSLSLYSVFASDKKHSIFYYFHGV